MYSNCDSKFDFIRTRTPPYKSARSFRNIVSTPKQPNCKKRCGLCKKKQHEKSCEIKGGGPEVAVVV